MKRNGFTLLELSMVIAIMGLIVGAIFTGQALIRSSEMQTALGEYDAYVKALGEFQTKFMALPGDMNNAESMWGTDGSCPATPSSTGPHVATCNGDGNGMIGSSDFNAVLGNSYEWFRAWQQLANAGFVPTSFTGTYGNGGVEEAVAGQNIPASSVRGGGWTLLYFTLTSNLSDTSLWPDLYGHIFIYGGFKAGGLNKAPILSAGEAFAIDQKIDDGNPGLGIVRAWRVSVLPDCTNNDSSQTAQSYIPSGSSEKVCSLVFLMRN